MEIIESHGSLEESLEKGLAFNDDVQQIIEHCSSNDQEAIKADLKNAIVDRLFDHALPRVLEKLEPVIKSVSAGNRQTIMNVLNKPETFLGNLKNQETKKLTTRSDSSRSHMNEIISRKPIPTSFDNSSSYHGFLSSRGLRRPVSQTDNEILESSRSHSLQLQVPNSKLKRTSSLSSSNRSDRQVRYYLSILCIFS